MPSESEYEAQTLFDERQAVKRERDALRVEKAEWVKVFDDMVLVQQRTEAERDALRAVVDAARQLRAARIEMMTYGWNAHEQEAQATQALMQALIALNGACPT